jgi:hypothetical protein
MQDILHDREKSNY